MSYRDNIIKTVAKGGALAFFATITSDVIGIAIMLILTRFLGPHFYGVYALGITISGLSSQVSLLGMKNGILRFFPIYREQPKELRGLLSSAFGLVVTISLIMMIFYLLTANLLATEVFKEPELTTVIRIFSLVLPFIVCINLIASVFQSEKNIFRCLTINVLYQKFFYFGLLIILALLGLKLYSAVLAYLLSFIIVCLIAILYFNREISPLTAGGAGEASYHFKDLLHFSAPAFLIGFTYMLLIHIDRIMIGIFLDSSVVGIYVVSAKIAIFMNIFLGSFHTIFVPYISGLYFKNKIDELARVFKIVTKWVWASSIILFMFFFFLAKPILSIFGKDFSSGWLAFILLSLFFLINSGIGSGGFIQMIGRQYIDLINCICAVLLNIALNAIFIPKLGINGVALATGISLVAMSIVRLIEIFLIIKIHPFSKSYLKIGIGFILSGLLALSINYLLKAGMENQIISFLFFFIIYVSFLYFILNEEDKLIVKGIKRKIGILN